MLATVLARREAESPAHHLARCVMVSSIAAGLTALGARLSIPWWPVPMTLQVFVVLLCGAGLGRRWGTAAQAEYVLAGTLGLPVFAGGRAGPGVLLGPTGGYLAGFVAAAYVTGWLTEALGRRGARPYAATLAGAVTIWVFGWAWLAVWMAVVRQEAAPLRAAFAAGVMPFMVPDVVKAAAAAAAARPLNKRGEA
jgi:biotin transport system substrate-specific component